MRKIIAIENILYSFNNETIALQLFPINFTKACKYIYSLSEKPSCVLFEQCRSTRLVLHLKQWHIINEVKSIIQLHYAQKPRNPE